VSLVCSRSIGEIRSFRNPPSPPQTLSEPRRSLSETCRSLPHCDTPLLSLALDLALDFTRFRSPFTLDADNARFLPPVLTSTSSPRYAPIPLHLFKFSLSILPDPSRRPQRFNRANQTLGFLIRIPRDRFLRQFVQRDPSRPSGGRRRSVRLGAREFDRRLENLPFDHRGNYVSFAILFPPYPDHRG